MRRVEMDGEQRRVWKGHVAVAMLLAVAIALSSCKVGGSDGKVTLGKGQAPDTQATLGSSVAPAATAPAAPSLEARAEPVTFEQAEGVYREGRYGEAATLFAAYAERKPENAWGQYMLGLAAWKAGDAERAEAAFGRALEIDPSHLKSWVNLARVFLDVGQADSALDCLGQAQTLDSTSGEVYRLLGRARSETGQVEDAVEAYRTAVTLDDQDAWAFNNLGVLDIEQGLPGDAVGALARAADLRPDVATFHNNLGMALEQLGYFEAAQDEYGLAVQGDSTYRKAAANLQRLDGRKDRAGLPPLDLPGLEQKFLEQVIRRSGPTS
jgi:tetratricopeptide (TPR) repeat protein